MAKRLTALTLSGREFKVKDFNLIKEIVSLYPNLSRSELARTICELLNWYQSDGEPKYLSCFPVLEKMEAWGHIKLPLLKDNGLKGYRHTVKFSGASDAGKAVTGSLNKFSSPVIERIEGREEVLLWKEYMERYHYLGHKNAFGSQLKYFIRFKSGELLGCLLFSASAWSVSCRDNWIGWNSAQRSKNLHLLINHSRFLIFPWVKVKNLASKVLSLAAKQAPNDWEIRYNYSPVMLETFVDSRFRGVCYRAANWKYLGETKGRGRMDRNNQYPGSPKGMYVFPLCANFREELCKEKRNV